MLSRPADNNFLSFDQLTHNNQIFIDVNANPLSQMKRPEDYDDLLKVSGRWGTRIENFDATSGSGNHREDGIDINNESRLVTFCNGHVQAGKKGVAITNKGGNSGTLFDDVVIVAPYGRFVDIEDGNHSDQSWKKTTGTFYRNVRRADGKPVRYAWGRADRATFQDTNVKVVWWYTLALHVYVYVKQIFYPSNKK